jgi:membrane-bound serine protease (ClpP class)
LEEKMLARRKILLMLAPLAALLAADTPAPTESIAKENRVVFCRIEGEINDGILILVKRALGEAEGAKAIIFEIDTYGGRVDSAVEIANQILDAPCDTVAFVTGRGAISAGALISYACNRITMEPATNFGDCQPIVPSAEGAMPVGEKETSFVRSKIRSLAEANGHNADIAAAMVDQRIALRGVPKGDGTYDVSIITDDELKKIEGVSESKPALSDELDKALDTIEEKTGVPVGPIKEIAKSVAEEVQRKADEENRAESSPEKTAKQLLDGSILVDSEDTLLTLTSDEAVRYGLIQATTTSVHGVISFLGYAEVEIDMVVMTRWEKLAWWLMTSQVSAILLMMGLAGIYYEFRTPGISLPGIVGVTCLALFFGARYIVGLAEVLDIILLAAGLILIAVEIFVLPGFGISGVAGIICLLLGGYLSMTRVIIPVYSWDYVRLSDAAQTLLVAAIAGIVWGYVAIKYIPRTPFGRALVADARLDSAIGYTVQTAEQERSALGLQGVAETVLRPAGRGRFNGKLFDVVSNGDYIEPGSPIVIVQVEGNRYVVDPVKGPSNGHA